MPRVILHIGHQRLLLPSDKGLPVLLKAFHGARQVATDRRYESGNPIVEIYGPAAPHGLGDDITVEASLLNPKVRVVETPPEPPQPTQAALPAPRQLALEG